MSPVKSVEEWDAKIKQQSLHLKFDSQLVVIANLSTKKAPRVQRNINELLLFPDAKKKEIYDSYIESGEITPIEDGATELPLAIKDKIDTEYQHELDFYQTKWDRLQNLGILVAKEQELRLLGLVERKPIGTTYYVDFNNGHDVNNDGTTPVKSNGDGPWATLDKATATLTAGDKAIVRRGMTQAVTQDLNFTNDGTLVSPIIIEADYDNAWNDRVDLSGTATATLTFGSKTVTYSADISGVLSAGDWIYVSGDATRDFAYEVASVVTDTVTLYLPYKGAQTGLGKTTYNMKSAPIWNTAAGDYETNLDDDHYWKFQGLHFRGTDISGVFEFDSVIWAELRDCIFEGNGISDSGIKSPSDSISGIISKCRFYNYTYGIYIGHSAMAQNLTTRDSLLDGNSAGSSKGVYTIFGGTCFLKDCELKNHVHGDLAASITAGFSGAIFYLRNCLLSSATEFDSFDDTDSVLAKAYSEDHDQSVGVNKQAYALDSAAGGTIALQSEGAIVRSGGGSTSIKITPLTNLSTSLECGRICLFEYPIYAVANVAKTYTVYFKSSAIGNWTADPTNTGLWIEAEYWGHASNKHRKITKSTGTCDFNGDDVNWLTLTVTVTPLQTGVLYLQGYYCKPKEAGKSNIFYCDTKIGVS